MITNTIALFIVDPKSKEDKVKITNLKKKKTFTWNTLSEVALLDV